MRRLLFLIGALWLSLGYAQQQPFNQHDFAHYMAAHYHFNEQKVLSLLNHHHSNPTIIHKIKTPYEALSWERYRRLFVTKGRIYQGLLFWSEHDALLHGMENRFGVPAEVIVAILGIETAYGEHMGRFSAFDALATLAFDAPSRRVFFQHELASYFLLCRDLGVDVNALKSSYAGALGMPQFMPDSYLEYAKTLVPGAYPDLVHNPEDAIISVANYLAAHGWRAHQHVANPVHGLQKTLALGYYGDQSHHSVLLVDKVDGQVQQWRAGSNFSVLLTYNRSPLYAMAVWQLARQLKARRQEHVA